MNILCTTPLKHLIEPYKLLQSFGEVDYQPFINRNEILTLDLSKYDVIFCCPNGQPFIFNKDTLQDFKGTILTGSTGLNHIDLDYCKKNNIKVLSHKNDHTELLNHLPSTSELAFGLMMSLLRNIPQCQQDILNHKWNYSDYIGRQVKDLKIGIVGYGRLGKMMYNYCKAFGAEVMVYDPYVTNIGCNHLEEMCSKADVISLHVHVTNETKYMIDKKLLGLMKKNSYIINTSRGEIVNEEDIIDALKSNKLAGYAADVVEHEFTDITESPIIKAMNEGKNIILTPHVGGSTWEGQNRAFIWSINKLKGLI